MISKERLLEVAREVFLELGIRATTAEVAARAGVAEGTIFHRFKSKEELFRSAMQFDPDQALAYVEALPARAGQGELRATLVDFARRFLEFGRVAMPVVMMSWSNPESQMCLERTTEKRTRYERMLTAVSVFFQTEMKVGRLRPMESEVLARMLIGSLHHFCMIELFTGGGIGAQTYDTFAVEVVDVLLAAAAPAQAFASAHRRTHTERTAKSRRRA